MDRRRPSELPRLHPNPEAHNDLGIALISQGRPREAERMPSSRPSASGTTSPWRTATWATPCRLRGGSPTPSNLFAWATNWAARHAAGTTRPPNGSARVSGSSVELDRLLPKVLRGDAEPATAAEGLELASLCQHPSKRPSTPGSLRRGGRAWAGREKAQILCQHRRASGQGLWEGERKPDA